jgi:3-methyladenine DNA glycosylase Mpg
MPEAFRSYAYRLSTTGTTYVATGVTGTTGVTGVTLIRSINVANVDLSNNATITVKLHQGSTGYALAANVNVATGVRYQVLDAPLAVRQGDSVSALASAADRLEVVVSALEIT